MSAMGNDFYKAFDRFEKLPEHCLNSYGAFQWFKAMTSTNAGVTGSYDCFGQIPPNLITDELRRYAISLSVVLLELIEPDHTPAYTSICLLAYRSSYRALEFFKEEARTTEMVDSMLAFPNSFFNAYRAYPWVAQVMTPDLIAKAANASSDFMLTLPDDQIDQAVLEKHLGESNFIYKDLKRAGRLQLGVDFIKNGGWPESDGPFDDLTPRPESLLEGFSLLLGTGDIPRALYMAYVMTHDIEDVIAMVVTPSCAKLVVEIYDEKELRPHIRSNRHLKAALLENSLGL